MNYQEQYDEDSVRTMDDDQQAGVVADFLLAEFQPDDANEELQQAILDGLAALEGCEAFDIEELPALDVGNFEEWMMGLELPQAASPPELRRPHHLPMTPPGTPPPNLSPPSTSPSPVMHYDGDETYYEVLADHVQWEAPVVVEEDCDMIEVEVEDNPSPELIIVTDDEEEDVQIVCEITYRPHKRPRDRPPSPPPRKMQRRNSV